MIQFRSTETDLKRINISHFKLDKYLYRSNKVWFGAQPSMSTIKVSDNVEKLLDYY